MEHKGLEIERKYLICMPDEAKLSQMPGCEIWDIVQTYLLDGEQGETRRLRSIACAGEKHYIFTQKRRLSELSHDEREWEIPFEDYRQMRGLRNVKLNEICKRRYRIPFEAQMLEIDIYSFWKDRATLEIELESESQAVVLPDWLRIVRELTGERAYKNRFLAECVPMEDLN